MLQIWAYERIIVDIKFEPLFANMTATGSILRMSWFHPTDGGGYTFLIAVTTPYQLPKLIFFLKSSLKIFGCVNFQA